MTVEKTFSCGKKGCGLSITVYSPDDEYTFASVKPPKEGQKEGEDYITRTGVCSAGDETTIYWYRRKTLIEKTGIQHLQK